MRPNTLALGDFPIVLKSRYPVVEHHGRLSGGRTVVCADRLQLERAVQTWPAHHPVIAQRFIRATGEGLFGVAIDGSPRLSAHRRVRMMNPRGSGSSACIATPLDHDIAGLLERMLQETEWDGIFMAEFLRDAADTAWFMELNGRAWGSMALARCMEYEYPAWQAVHTVNPEFRPPTPIPGAPPICRHLGRELVHLGRVKKASRAQSLGTRPTRRQTLRDMLRVGRNQRLYNFRKDQLSIFLWDSIYTVYEQMRQRRGR